MTSKKPSTQLAAAISFYNLRYFILLSLLVGSHVLLAQSKVEVYKNLSLEELMNIEVTTVSKQPEMLSEIASAIQVVREEDIRRSPAARLPEALALTPNLLVSRFNSYTTMVTARGFNAVFANKLLVMIDGRTVYSPLFAGTYWDVQNVLMEDIDRIEVVSGPGGTLWGANAVNGVINVLTKSSEETQGLYVSGAYGNYLKNFGAIRYGGRLSKDFTYRVFAQRNGHDTFLTPEGGANSDKWNISQGGFRVDGHTGENSTLMVQGNAYGGTLFTTPSESAVDGQNLMGRWNYAISSRSDLIVQVYYDRTWRRDIPSTVSDQMETWDVDFQHGLEAGNRHALLWGLGYRFIRDESSSTTDFVGFVPPSRNMPLYSGFIQDEITLSPDILKLTIGSKFLHNVYSGFEVQPSARLAWTPEGPHTFWAAASRAIRAPSRIDVDYYIPKTPVPAGSPGVRGGPDFDAEKLLAYELGYRVQPSGSASFSLASFFNRYYDLYSVDPVPNDPVQFQIMNNSEGFSRGVEISGIYRFSEWWRLRGGYTWFNKKLRNKPGSVFDIGILGYDPDHVVVLQSKMDLPANFQFDIVGRYVSTLPGLEVPAYFDLGVRLAYVYNGLEISVNGRNLLHESRPEFAELEVPRNVYGQLVWRWQR